MTKEFKVYVTTKENEYVAGLWIAEAISQKLTELRERKIFNGSMFTIDVVDVEQDKPKQMEDNSIYKEIKDIDYVFYINKNDNRVHMLDLINNKKETVQNTGEPWNNSAYGNCLIALQHAKSTDALYLLTKQGLDSIGKVDITNTKEVEKALKEKAVRVVESQ